METNTIQEIDLHRLTMRFDHTRVMEPGVIGRLRHSIERFGQLISITKNQINLFGKKSSRHRLYSLNHLKTWNMKKTH